VGTERGMPIPRTQFTVRRMMAAIAVSGVLLGLCTHRNRRIRTLDQMVTDQAITVLSATANAENARLDREAAELSLELFMKNHDGPHTSIPQSKLVQPPLSADQSRVLAKCEADLAIAERASAKMVQQLGDGTYADADAGLSVLKDYFQKLKHLSAATQARQAAGTQSVLETAPAGLEDKIDAARRQERVKKLILDYENAKLKHLKRKRANVWW
jgi:hypothetical protein